MQRGGIAALVDLNRETDGALAADMLEILHIPITQAHLVGWGDICNWVKFLGEESHTYKALHPEYQAPRLLTAEYLACLVDVAAMINFNYARHGKGKKPDPIYRPWAAPKDKHFGKDPIPVRDFESWYYGGK